MQTSLTLPTVLLSWHRREYGSEVYEHLMVERSVDSPRLAKLYFSFPKFFRPEAKERRLALLLTNS